MKILVVHEVSFPKKVVYEIHEFPELLALKGHEITFVDFDEGAERGSLITKRDRTVTGRIHSGAKIRLITPHVFGLGSLDRIWAMFSSLPIFWRLIASRNFDVILNFAVPTYGLQVNLIAKLFSIPVVHRALDVSHKIQKTAWNPLIRIFEKWVLRLSTAVSANNPAMLAYVAQELPKRSIGKAAVHYPPLDLEVIKAVNFDDSLARSLGIDQGDRVAMYMGSFFYFSGLDLVLLGMRDFLLANPNIKILLIGGGEQDEYLRSLVAKEGLEQSVVFTGFVAFQDLGRYMSLAEVAINPLLPEEVASVAFPQKVLQYLAVGLPVISTRLDGLTAAFGDSQPIRWREGPNEVAVEVIKALSLPRERLVASEKQQRALIEMFSPERAAGALEAFLQKTINTK